MTKMVKLYQFITKDPTPPPQSLAGIPAIATKTWMQRRKKIRHVGTVLSLASLRFGAEIIVIDFQ